MMAKMSGEEMQKAIEAKKKLCICRDCPSYNECAKESNELLYCAIGKSPKCITGEVGCICPGCPVTEQMGLKSEYFCTRGSEKEQRGM
ncbi:MAG: DUF2769 domain-containing protein [Candidatus Bathyarchaeota archaeon]|nr:MAG: DUF2769 domain-containing protein [Candidatus Bathyarchaeota archaeon]